MPSLDMYGPYDLTASEIAKVVTRVSAGNYALGRVNDKGLFTVNYVGRSDSDVAARLKSWVGKSKEPDFKFSYATSPKAAFEKECENYHDFDPSGNSAHPQRPAGTNWQCPRCRVFSTQARVG